MSAEHDLMDIYYNCGILREPVLRKFIDSYDLDNIDYTDKEFFTTFVREVFHCAWLNAYMVKIRHCDSDHESERADYFAKVIYKLHNDHPKEVEACFPRGRSAWDTYDRYFGKDWDGDWRKIWCHYTETTPSGEDYIPKSKPAPTGLLSPKYAKKAHTTPKPVNSTKRKLF